MSVMHGCEPFEALWSRRRRLRIPGLGTINVLSLADLVQAKKTQRDKDWPMIRRLIEVDHANRPRRPSSQQIHFWLLESRTAEMLIDLCRHYPKIAMRQTPKRSLLKWACQGNLKKLEEALRNEEQALRLADREYWQPLRAELFE